MQENAHNATCLGVIGKLKDQHVNDADMYSQPNRKLKTMTLNDTLVRGENFIKLADHVLAHRKIKHCDPKDIKDGDIVYCDTNKLYKWKHTLLKHKNLVIITHDSINSVVDHNATSHKTPCVEEYKGCFRYWFAKNCNSKLENVIQIPLGFKNKILDNDGKDADTINTIDISVNPTKLIYSNFNIETNPTARQHCRNICDNIKGVTVDESRIPYKKYLERILDHKYVISPEGSGVDCYRHWESLFLGRVPIIKHGLLDELYNNLPVLIVDDWSELEHLPLDDMYDEILKKTNREIITQAYWDKLILDKINEK
jgi:hypothetical protein